MNDEYCYDSQFNDLENILIKISGQLEEMKGILKSNKNKIEWTPQTNEVTYRGVQVNKDVLKYQKEEVDRMIDSIEMAKGKTND